MVSRSLACSHPSHTAQDSKLGLAARFMFLFHIAHLVFSYLFQALFCPFKHTYFKSHDWRATEQPCRCNFFPPNQRGSPGASPSARVDLREGPRRSPCKNSSRPRLMHLRRAVYRAAAFNLTLIKHFKCSYRNRVTNPNSTLLTECRLSLQSPV